LKETNYCVKSGCCNSQTLTKFVRASCPLSRENRHARETKCLVFWLDLLRVGILISDTERDQCLSEWVSKGVESHSR